MEANQTTLDSYQNQFGKYIATTPKNTFVETWLVQTLGHIEKDTSILEIGSAFGRDALFMKEAGYTNVTVTDAFDAAIDTLKKQGLNAKKFNALTDELDEEFGLIFASAVFLHFTEQQFESTLNKLRSNLGSKGILAFTVKEGGGEEWSKAKLDTPRFFYYWREDSLIRTVEKCGYKVLDIVTNEEFSQKWLAMTCAPTHDDPQKI